MGTGLIQDVPAATFWRQQAELAEHQAHDWRVTAEEGFEIIRKFREERSWLYSELLSVKAELLTINDRNNRAERLYERVDAITAKLKRVAGLALA